VNQNWAGHPGFLLDEYDTPAGTAEYVWSEKCSSTDATQRMWKYDSATKTIRTSAPPPLSSPSSNADMCLSSGGDTSTTALVVADCATAGHGYETSTPQQWEVNTTAHTITQNNKCLDSYNGQNCGKNPIGTGRIDLYRCNSGENQKWFIGANGTITDGCGGG
jgi:hypothetical protein